MERIFVIEYAEKVIEIDLPNLPKLWCLVIKKSLENKLAKRPDIYGKPLHGTLASYRKFRIGVYRAIFDIRDNKIRIVIIEHRKHVYQMALRRLGVK